MKNTYSERMGERHHQMPEEMRRAMELWKGLMNEQSRFEEKAGM